MHASFPRQIYRLSTIASEDLARDFAHFLRYNVRCNTACKFPAKEDSHIEP